MKISIKASLDVLDEHNPISQHHQINIPNCASDSNTPPPIKLPHTDLVGVIRDDYNKICVPLYKASITSDWETTKLILEERPELVRYSITENYETPLHIAVSARYTKEARQFVEKLVSWMEKDDLELKNGNGETALGIATVTGNVVIAKILVKKNDALLTIPNSQGNMPLSNAALYGKHENMVEYLYETCQKMTPTSCWTHQKRDYVLLRCIEANLFGFVSVRTKLFLRRISLFCGATVPIPVAPALKLLRIIWSSVLKLNKDEISDILRGPPDSQNKYSSQMLFLAAECGNKIFLIELIREYPDLIRKVNDDNQSILHVVVTHRHRRIFNLLKQMGPILDSIISLEDENGNNMLHLAGQKSKSDRVQHVPGVVLQLQQQLVWFKEVETITPLYLREKKNKDGLTPCQVFTKNHQELVTKGEKWMKEVASQVMVVSTLIAAVAFALPFTVPGGFDQVTGIPIFIHKRLFAVLVILDALSLMFASNSLLFVMSILMSSYAEADFLTKLPSKLMGCLEALFYALVTMMLTFVISFFLLYQHKEQSLGVPISIVVFAFILFLQFCSFSSEVYPLFMHTLSKARSLYPESIRLNTGHLF